MTAYATLDSALQALRLGAFDYIQKPFDLEDLKHRVDTAARMRKMSGELEFFKKAQYRVAMDDVGIVAENPAMKEILATVRKVAPTSATVLITGETGTGKEVLASLVHFQSPRREQPLVKVNCAALHENLLESELFGHVKGSFTGAVASKRGMFEVAHGGTLFLDEIGNLSLSTQAKLLRVIQEREFRAVGDTRTQTTDVRLIAATNKDLKAMVAEGTFREDLYYRINIFPIQVPPLRARREDIPALAHHFLNVLSKEVGKKFTGFSEGAMSLLMQHDWRGNVRELENAVHRAVILATGDLIRKAHLAGISDAGARMDLDIPKTSDELKRLKKAARERSVEEIEKLFVLEALKRNAWNVTRSAEETGMQRANFQALMKKYRIRVRDAEKPAGEADPGG